ncbi:hypothetical protein SBA2_120007 [Acidobacteriia bacterium SbA2]|nr:hypothetical protein SBA2_120007 [Acidobacteriia bacterium SbA2]
MVYTDGSGDDSQENKGLLTIAQCRDAGVPSPRALRRPLPQGGEGINSVYRFTRLLGGERQG